MSDFHRWSERRQKWIELSEPRYTLNTHFLVVVGIVLLVAGLMWGAGIGLLWKFGPIVARLFR